jgi:hypothetical protein
MSTGEDKAACQSDPLVSVSIKIRASQREKTLDINLSETVRGWIDTYCQ